MFLLDCNVILKGHQGAIEITKQENQRLDKICSWTIMAPQGNRVNITFTSFKLNPRLLRYSLSERSLFKLPRTNKQLTVSTYYVYLKYFYILIYL